jgi:hypothetical protein
MPAREVTLPSYVPHAPDKPIKGVIMSVEGGVSEFGQFSIITINRGSRDGVEVGHVLGSYRRGVPVGVPGAQATSSWTVGPDQHLVQPLGLGPATDRIGAGAGAHRARSCCPTNAKASFSCSVSSRRCLTRWSCVRTGPIYVGDIVQDSLTRDPFRN